MTEITMKQYADEFYYPQYSTFITQGCVIVDENRILNYFTPPILKASTNLHAIGVTSIQNACDLEISINPNGKQRDVKTATVDCLYLFDAKEFFSLPEFRKYKKTYIKSLDMDLRFTYIPYHTKFNTHYHGLIADCMRSVSIPVQEFAFLKEFVVIKPPYRERIKNLHLKYDLRVPTSDFNDQDIEEWFKDPVNYFI